MLEADTLRRMQELFEDKKCCRCQRPAQRFRQPSFYYCRDCFPGRDREPITRVHRAPRGQEEAES